LLASPYLPLHPLDSSSSSSYPYLTTLSTSRLSNRRPLPVLPTDRRPLALWTTADFVSRTPHRTLFSTSRLSSSKQHTQANSRSDSIRSLTRQKTTTNRDCTFTQLPVNQPTNSKDVIVHPAHTDLLHLVPRPGLASAAEQRAGHAHHGFGGVRACEFWFSVRSCFVLFFGWPVLALRFASIYCAAALFRCAFDCLLSRLYAHFAFVKLFLCALECIAIAWRRR